MRFTRAGKSTHQRVAGEPTGWDELKATPPKQKNSSKNGNFKQGGSGGGGGGNGNRGRDGGADKRFKGKRTFGRSSNKREVEISANFVELGERAKPNGGKKVVLGSGSSKQVKIFGQFWVPADDARRIQGLAKKFKAEGMSKKDILEALKNERRRAEKSARRARDKTCFNCRQFGHVLFDCPNVKAATNGEGDSGTAGEVDTTNMLASEICFKCGSTEHSSRHCKRSADKFDFAKCFICSKTGHIARQCPENTKGIYPSGGSCNECGEATHLAKDCPTLYPIEGGSNFGNAGTDDVVTGRIVNPFISPEYEGVGVGGDVKANNAKVKFSEVNAVKSNDIEQAPPQSSKKRRVKF